MAYAAPTLDQMFGGDVDRFEAYKSALDAVHANTLTAARSGQISFDPTKGVVKNASVADRVAELSSDITKALTGDQLAAAQSALQGVTDLQKDLTLTSPLNNTTSGISGLVPYDLSPVLSYLIPKELFLRNSIPRIKGQGQAFEFRRITGLSNAGVGGVGQTSSFFSSATASTSFGGVSLNRPTKITYAADKIVKSYVEQGLSDSVALQAEFAGQGYTSLRQLSQTSLVWAMMLAEERNLANAVSTALSTSGLTFTGANDATAVATGAASGTATVQVTLSSAYGETAALSAGSVTLVANQGVKVTYTGTVPNGCVALNIYITDSASKVWKASQISTASGVAGNTFAAATVVPSTDGSYNTYAAGANGGTGYDGFVSTLSQSGGYVNQFNAAVSSQSEPGGFLQDAFISLFNSTMADPDVVITTAAVRRAIAKGIQSNAGTASYRLNYETGADGVVLGSLVQAIQNEATGKMVELVTHRFLPAGTAIVHSTQLPFPDSGVSATVEVHGPVDMLVLEYPVIGLSYDSSIYSYNNVAFRAPAWSGIVTGITG